VLRLLSRGGGDGRAGAARVVTGGFLFALVSVARADVATPPWSDPNDLPLPRWAKTIAPHKDDLAVFSMPSRDAPRRGSLFGSARPPLYGALRAPGCAGRWLSIGPFAWVCSDEAELAADDVPPLLESAALPPVFAEDGLPFRYAFVGPDGAYGYRDLEHADEAAPDAELDPGFAVAVVSEANAHGERWGKTSHGMWIALRQLNAVQPPTLRGERIADPARVDVAWVIHEHAVMFAEPAAKKASGARQRFEIVHRREEQNGPSGAMVRVSDDGVTPQEWMREKDLSHPTTAPPPAEVGESASARWIDVELASETLVAYEGSRPVFGALVATGRGAQGTDTATPVGVHRIWVKLMTSSMGNLGDEDAESHYSIEDVPYVQFFAKGVALHGAFWHHSFGQAHSHGCVNLAPVDARWLFAFTSPRLPTGWSAVLPAPTIDPGTVVRVRP